MRKIMLAATAIVGVTGLTAGIASAQMPNQPIVSDSFGLNGQGGDFPAPGTVTVRFRARVDVELGYNTDTAQVGKTTAGKPNGSKNGGTYMGSAIRMYPGVDGTMANGMKYGGAIEMRVNAGGTSGSAANTVYVRRQFLYFAGSWGKAIIGQTDDALGQQYNIGAIESFDWTGTANGSNSFSNAAAVPNWPFWENGGAYVANKITYLTPNFYGVTAGASWEPTATTGETNCTQASATGCPTQTSVPNNLVNVRRNTAVFAARYKGSFGPVAADLLVGYVGSGHVNSSANTAVNGVVAPTVKGLSVFDAGAVFTFAGISVGGHYIGGNINAQTSSGTGGGYGMIFKGQKQQNAFLVGTQYQFGAMTVGANFQNQWSAGAYNPGYLATAANPYNGFNTMMHESSIGVGGAWDWAPGSTAYVSAVYAKRRQAGWDLLNGVAGSNNNNTQTRWLVIGNNFRW